MGGHRWAALAGALLLGSIWTAPACAQSDRLALAVKATFLVKFGAYVGWPPTALAEGAPLVICTVHGSPLDDLLDAAAKGQSIAGHAVQVRHLARIDRSSGCGITYLGDDRGSADLAGAPILTVTDEGGAHGGMIDFKVVAGHVRFVIDQGAASDAGLTISSKLLQIALSVRQAGK